MKGLGGIGRTQRVADRAALVAIDEVVLDSAQGDGLRYIPGGVVKGQCGGGDGRFAGVAGSNRDGDGAVGWTIEHKGRAVVRGTFGQAGGVVGHSDRGRSAVGGDYVEVTSSPMEGVGWIGGGDGVADGGGLIAIDAVVFGSRDGESLGDRPGGVVKAHRGWRERGLGGVTRRESDGDGAVGWAREDEGLGVSSAFVDGDDLHRSRGAQSGRSRAVRGAATSTTSSLGFTAIGSREVDIVDNRAFPQVAADQGQA